MKNLSTERLSGFTLIELLVVVLIIGILAGIALPQYERAVMKSRYGTMIPLVKSLADAQESYFMANGHYTSDLTELDVEIPATFSPTSKSFESFGGSVYTNKDSSIYVGVAMNGPNILGVQFMFPNEWVGYRITLQNSILAVGQRGKHYCIEVGITTLKKYCPWLANTPEKEGAYWYGYWFPIN